MGRGLPPTPPCPALLLGAADGVGDSCPIPPGARPRSSACRRPSGAPAPAPHGSAMRGLLLALCALAGKGCPPRGVGGVLGVPPSTGFVLGGLSPMGAGLHAWSPWVSPCPVCAPPGTFSGACAPSPCTTSPQSCQQPPGASPAPSSPPWGAPTALRVPPPRCELQEPGGEAAPGPDDQLQPAPAPGPARGPSHRCHPQAHPHQPHLPGETPPPAPSSGREHGPGVLG